MALAQFLSFLQQTVGRGSKSTALQPLIVLISIWVASFVASLYYKAASWIVIAILAAGAAIVLVYLGAYIFLVVTNVDATRSEKFILERLALQQSRVGDDNSGFSNKQVTSYEGRTLNSFSNRGSGE